MSNVIDLWLYRHFRKRIEYSTAEDFATILADIDRANRAVERTLEITKRGDTVICRDKPRFRSRLEEQFQGWFPDAG